MMLFWNRSAERALKLFAECQSSLKINRPDIYARIKHMTVASGFRAAGKELGIDVPAGSSLSVLREISEKAAAGHSAGINERH